MRRRSANGLKRAYSSSIAAERADRLGAEIERLDRRIRARRRTLSGQLEQVLALLEERGYTATNHQREVGAGYFDRIATTVDPTSSTTALAGSTEEGQFH